MTDVEASVEATELLRPRTVADLLGVDRRTVARFADGGRLRATRTPGGHRRFLAGDVRALLAGEGVAEVSGRPAHPQRVETARPLPRDGEGGAAPFGYRRMV
ncbi:helix-turn-helix domain-containing protein [Cellulomonas sp.]|uniref:helix-turn-helix domain-containing protein n=1 Tax=Cellulomonas sp. TaxID=40001 RepID=UPI003BAD774C